MQVSVQNRSTLYEKGEPVLVPEGLHLAKLVDVRKFINVFGERVGLVFRISTGSYAGQEVMESAAVSPSPRGKLSELLRGMGGPDGSMATAQGLIGHQCQVAVQHEVTKAGKPYAAITRTFK